jgi:hypothetical protein
MPGAVGRLVRALLEALAAARRALQLDRWTAWGRMTGVRLAAELGLDHDRVCDLLEARVAAYCGKLERDFRP